MKILKITLLFLLLSTQMYSANFAFARKFSYEQQWQSAFEKATKEQKPMMVMFVTSTCPWCKKLENQVLSKPAINEYLHKNFVVVLLDKDHDAYPSYLEVDVVPTLYFVNAKTQKPFEAIVGYKNKDEFLTLVKQIFTDFKANK